MARVFITGGASGLGRALAERWAQDGARVCLADVHEARGVEAEADLRSRGADAVFVRCDVTREEDLERARDLLLARWGGVDVVVNNAGVALAGAIDAVSIEDWRWILEVNLLGVVRGCRVFVPLLARQGRGHLVNVASMAGLVDMPFMTAYNATKAAVVSLSESLQNELAPRGVGVTVVCPSFFATNLHETMRAPDPALRASLLRLFGRSRVTAAHVADDVVRAVATGRFYVLSHADGRAAWRLKRLLPRSLWTSLLRRQARRVVGRGARDPHHE